MKRIGAAHFGFFSWYSRLCYASRTMKRLAAPAAAAAAGGSRARLSGAAFRAPASAFALLAPRRHALPPAASRGMFGHNIGGKITTYGGRASVVVKLFSEAGTGYSYTWKKNPKAMPWKIALMKYDPIVRKKVLFRERKAG